MQQTDQDLIVQYRLGSVEALQTLVERYRRPLFAFILNMTDGQEDADEVFQEVWLRAIRKIGSYRRGNFLAWLFRICHNLVVDRARSRKRVVSLNDGESGECPLTETLASADPGPSGSAAARDLSRCIEAAVQKLPDKQKEVFLMRVEGDLSFREIAAIQGVSINTALARMHYAVSKLREALAAEYQQLRG